MGVAYVKGLQGDDPQALESRVHTHGAQDRPNPALIQAIAQAEFWRSRNSTFILKSPFRKSRKPVA
jgi:hypothetical protein